MKRTFPQLSPKAFMHPVDRMALEALQKAKFIDVVIGKFSSWFSEKHNRLFHISTNIRISPRQYPKIYACFAEAAEILDVEVPEIYLDIHPRSDIYITGIQNPMIIVSSTLVDQYDEDEWRVIAGQQMGYIKCKHQLYLTLANFFLLEDTNTLEELLPMNIGVALTKGIQLPICYWYTMAEFSGDRAALLVMQDPQFVCNALMKIAGFGPDILSKVSMAEIVRQANEYQNPSGALDQFFKFYRNIGRTEPMPIVRVKEIIEWSRSEEYQRILNGDYLTVADELQAVRGEVDEQSLCPECGKANPSNSKFCFKCGHELSRGRVCPHCRAPLVAETKFCFTCGGKLTGSPTRPGEP